MMVDHQAMDAKLLQLHHEQTARSDDWDYHHGYYEAIKDARAALATLSPTTGADPIDTGEGDS